MDDFSYPQIYLNCLKEPNQTCTYPTEYYVFNCVSGKCYWHFWWLVMLFSPKYGAYIHLLSISLFVNPSIFHSCVQIISPKLIKILTSNLEVGWVGVYYTRFIILPVNYWVISLGLCQKNLLDLLDGFTWRHL